MGHSTQEVDGRYLVLNDLDLAAVISLANLVVAESKDKDRFGMIVGSWNKAIETSGPGTIDLNLSRGGDPAAPSELRDLLRELKDKTISFGEIVPASILQRWDGVVFKDYPSRFIAEALDQIENFIG